MGRINKKVRPELDKKMEADVHLNFMGGAAYFSSNPLARLQLAASSSFFGEPKYYQRDLKEAPSKAQRNYAGSLGTAEIVHLNSVLNAIDPQEWRTQTPQQVMENAIDEAIKYDLEGTLKLAAEIRGTWNIRTTPQVILVRASMTKGAKNSGLIRDYAPRIILRTDEPAVQLAYLRSKYGNAPIPNSLKRSWADYFKKQDEYSLAKYRNEGNEVNIYDVINLCSGGKFGALHNPAVEKLMKGELKLEEGRETWESLVSRKGSTKDTWTEAVGVMGHMALLRNLRNLIEKGVDPALFADKLVATAANGRQLPFRYVAAYKAVGGAPAAVKRAIEKAMDISLRNIPYFGGNVMSLVDNSGSAHGAGPSSYSSMTIAEIGNMMGLVTAMASENGAVGVFGDDLKIFRPQQGTSIFDNLAHINKIGDGIGGGTENGIWLFWRDAIVKKEHWDTVFVYSDQQAGHGGLYGTHPREYSDFNYPTIGSHIDVAKLIAEYRKQVNPNVTVVLVQIAGYTDTILPEYYDRTYIIGGWSDAVLRFAGEMINMQEGGWQ